MRVVIDMQGAQTGSRFRGIGRYTMSFVRAVIRNRGQHDIILALSALFPETIQPIREAFYGLLPQDNVRVWNAPGPVKEEQIANDTRREVAEIMREAFLKALKPDVIHICSLFEGYGDDAVTSIKRFDQKTPVSVTLHDLIPLLNPDDYLKPDPSFERYYLDKIESLRKASLYLAISESSLQEGKQYLSKPEKFFVNTLEAVDSCFQPQKINKEIASKLYDRFGITRSFILYAGPSDERKNLLRLISAYASLPAVLRNKYQLVFAGGMPECNATKLIYKANSCGLEDGELVFTDYVSDEDLVQLYNLCYLFVFPSWHEGFGLPALEAMSCGAPVIGSNCTSIPEVIGLEEALFDPFDIASITAKLTQVLQDKFFHKQLCEHSLQQAKSFSWDSTAKRAIAAWETLHTNTSSLNKDFSPSLDEDFLITALSKVLKVSNAADRINVSCCLSQNEKNSSELFEVPKQILVDISELVQQDARSGIQRVVRSILHEWLFNPPIGCYRIEPVYATVNRTYCYARQFTARFLGIHNNTMGDEAIEYRPGDIFFGLDLQPQVQIAQQEFYQDLRRNGVQVQFLVHDLLCVSMPEYFGKGAKENFSQWLTVITQCDGAVCVSRTTAEDLQNWIIDNSDQTKLQSFTINWSHNGVDMTSPSLSKGLPSDAIEQLNLYRNRISFLMVGTVEPRKAHAQVIDAFEKLWGLGFDINLIIVGKQGWEVDRLAHRLRTHPEQKKRLFWFEGISDEYLEMLYTASTCLIAASYGEGFGLPLIEAAQYKLPIIAREIAVFREVAGENAFYFIDNKDADSIVKAISDWIKLFQRGRHPFSEAISYSSWKQDAKNILTFLGVGENHEIN